MKLEIFNVVYRTESASFQAYGKFTDERPGFIEVTADFASGNSVDDIANGIALIARNQGSFALSGFERREVREDRDDI